MDDHHFETIKAPYRQAVWEEIRSYLDTDIPGVSGMSNPGLEAFHWGLTGDYPRRGGKYIRPTFLMLTAEAMGRPLADSIKTAAAMEVSEDWLLIHDDFEDGSSSRRGEAALHLKYSDALAINAGDTLHLVMWKILRDNEAILGHKKTFEIMDEFFRMLMRTALGQTAEIKQIEDGNFDMTEADAFFIIDGKTSYYSIAGPLRLGAILAVDDRRRLEADIFPVLDELGSYAGRAFQIRDDILDLTSDFGGKKDQVGNDIYEGKRSVILVHLLSHANAADRQQVVDILKKPRAEKSREEVDRVIGMMRRYGSLAYATGLAEQYVEKALGVVAQIDFMPVAESKRILELGIRFLFERDH